MKLISRISILYVYITPFKSDTDPKRFDIFNFNETGQ